MEVEVKQEGEFKVNTSKKPKNLNKQPSVVKVDFSEKKEPVEEVKTVVIPNNTEQEVEDVVVVEEIEEVKDTLIEPVVEEEEVKTTLPENIEKLVAFMEETGGNIEDYVRLNTDYSKVDEKSLIKEYYKKTKPHLDSEEIDFLIEDEFEYDEDIEEERDIKKKKLAFKEEVAKAKSYVNSIKDKYYDEIKLRPGTTLEQKQASDFFNRYKKNEAESLKRHERFVNETKNLFNNEFKGFDFDLGEKKFRYGIQNTSQVAERQSDINNFVGKFLDKEGNVSDGKNYHKALYAAMNPDKLAQHFYEQGKADAIKEVVNNSKNPTNAPPRQTNGEVFVNGIRVKSVSGIDSSKLKIQTKKIHI